MDPKSTGRQASNAIGGQPGVRVAVLTDKSGALGSSALALDAPSLVVNRGASLEELVQLASAGAVDLVLADPGIGDGWPTETAERLVRGLQSTVPLILVCESAADAKLIEARLGRAEVGILLRDHLTPEQLVTAIRGAIVNFQARPATAE